MSCGSTWIWAGVAAGRGSSRPISRNSTSRSTRAIFPDGPASRPWRDRAAVVLILAGTFLRFQGLHRRGIWHDEAVTLWRAGLPDWSQVLHAPPWVEPPLYYLLLHGWVPWFPGEGARLLSAAFGSAALVLAWLVLRRELARNEALAALALFALSPFEILYAQQARPYTLRVVLALAGLLALRRAIRTGRHRDWALTASTIIGSSLAHFLSLAWLPALGMREALARGLPRKRWTRAAGWAVAAAAPALALAVVRRGAIAHAVGSAHGPTAPAAFLTGLVTLFGAGAWVPAALARPAWLLFAVPACAGLLHAVAGIRRRTGAPPAGASILALGLTPPVLLMAANWTGVVQTPKIRFAIEAHLFLLVACVRGAALLPERWMRRGLIGALLLIEAAAVGRYAQGGFPPLDLPPCIKPFREAAAVIRSRWQPGDAVASFEYETYMPLKVLLGEGVPQGYLLRDPLAPDAELDWVGRPTTLAALTADHRRIWLVVAPVHYADPLDVPPELTATLGRTGRLETDDTVPGIRIQRWRLAGR
jgi:hypothetical protein